MDINANIEVKVDATWIDRVFVDGKYFQGGMEKKNLAATKANFRKSALGVLAESGADHVVYCHIEYDATGEVTMARFYTGIKMSDAEFYKTTEELIGDFYVGAVHKLKGD
jgi:hypothetical protein